MIGRSMAKTSLREISATSFRTMDNKHVLQLLKKEVSSTSVISAPTGSNTSIKVLIRRVHEIYGQTFVIYLMMTIIEIAKSGVFL